jgi:hypothetical protein
MCRWIDRLAIGEDGLGPFARRKSARRLAMKSRRHQEMSSMSINATMKMAAMKPAAITPKTEITAATMSYPSIF